MTAIHAATHSSGGKAHAGFEKVDDVSKVPGARQPLVRTHPETGRKCLFLGRRINAYIDRAAGRRKARHCSISCGNTRTRRNSPGSQEWRVGDLVWWDNRCAMHRRDAFDPAARRLMHRTQLKGTRPV